MSQLFCIKRDDANVTEYVRRLRNDKETSDVTLVGNDGRFVLAHRTVLICNSDYIKEMLRRNPSPSPLIRIPEVNSKELCRILDFIYYGKIVLNSEDMEKFIQQSKVLKVKGMSNDTYTVDIQSNENEGNQPLKDAEIIINFEENSKKKEVTLGDKYFSIDTDIEIVDVNLRNSGLRPKKLNNVHEKENFTVGSGDLGIIGYNNRGHREFQSISNNWYTCKGKTPPIIYFKGRKISKDEINMVVMKHAQHLQSGQYKCGYCEHISNNGSHIKEHVETHFTELFYKCLICSRMSKGSSGHRRHFNQGRCKRQIK